MHQHQLELPQTPLQRKHFLAEFQTKLAPLHAVGTARDKASSRDFFLDQYVGLLLLYFFYPTVTSLRSLRKLTELHNSV